MALVMIGLQLLLYSVSGLSPSDFNNQLPSPTVLAAVEDLKRFDPCCLQSLPPPPLFPPPPHVWRRGQVVGEYVEAERGRGCDEEDLILHCLAGTPGPDGPMGQKGTPGVQGPNGDKGDMGRPGSKGRTGRPGLPGRPGSAGWPGPEGPKGEKGDHGLMGEPGLRGPVGAKGLAGYKGEKGSQGELGVPGPKGDKGESGHAGMLGQKGETGPKGEAGVTGTRGLTGRPGKRGKQGSEGETGRTGPMGPSGSLGPSGQPGAPGLSASVLYVGGQKGEMGTPGPPGQCDCSSSDVNGPGSASLQRRDKYTRVSAIFVVNSEKELNDLHTDNTLVFCKEQTSLYFKDTDGWKPIQLPLHSIERRKKRGAGMCGDGVVQTLNGEECDDGNKVVTDECVGCRKAYCGDGYYHHGAEECDGKDFGYQTCKTYMPGTFGQLRCTGSCSIDSTGCKYVT
ncbi:acetylcholinesterase collagenic tail peptide [Tachysurus fulvidraco]|uniref:acetylcholinesterase collagenic tail peptide n=1 Tax=Tachysurus fulvidraco TaxID=1234273 RepID=UPI001FEDE123|nr:acetylcholinesterase collagenic tail peptide [Tachysurus fulvidraco]